MEKMPYQWTSEMDFYGILIKIQTSEEDEAAKLFGVWYNWHIYETIAIYKNNARL